MRHSLGVITVAVTLGTFTVVAQTNQPPATHKPEDVVARVGDHAIKWSELDIAVTGLSKQFTSYGRSVSDQQLPALRYDVLQQMITHELVLQDARGHEPSDLDEQVKKQIADAKLQLGGDEAFTKALTEMNVTPSEYTQRARNDLIVRDRVRQITEAQTKLLPEDSRSFYDKNPDKFKLPERVRASHILIRVPPDANEEVKKQKRTQIESIQTMLKGGEKFADLAQKFSEDPGSGRNGGDLNYFSRGQMVPEFEQTAFTLKTNEVSDIVTTKFGYHLLMVTDHQPAGERSFDDAKADIEKYLRYTKGQEIAAQHIKHLRDAGKIEVLLPKPELVTTAPVPAIAPTKPLPTVETKPVQAPKP